jgi:hypothetical protein
MTTRALVIAVERYPKAAGFAQELVGSNTAAEAFRAWLIAHKFGGADPGPDRLQFCGDGAVSSGVTQPPTRDGIIDAMHHLVQRGRGATRELYVYFSGHGFAYDRGNGPLRDDVIVGADLVDLARAGRAGILLSALQENTQLGLGAGDHYYFIDACRNVVGRNDVSPVGIDVAFGQADGSSACVLTLFSTRSGALAHVKSGFAAALLDGLQGKGRAKVRRATAPGRMAVTFERLSHYVIQQLAPGQRPTAAMTQLCEGVVREIDPAPTSRCSVTVAGLPEGEALELVLADPNGFFEKVQPFTSPATSIDVPPGDYGVRVRSSGGASFASVPPSSGVVDLWDSRELTFRFDPLESFDGSAGVAKAKLRIGAPPTTHLVVVSRDGETVFDDIVPSSDVVLDVAAGSYRLRVYERDHLLAEHEQLLEPADDQRVVVGPPPSGALGSEILKSTGNAPGAPLKQVSESLGAFADASLSLLLALVGASRIVERVEHFEKLRHVPLTVRFDDLLPGASALYVLSGDDDGAAAVRVGLRRAATPQQVSWRSASLVAGLPGLFEGRLDVAPGAYFVTIERAGAPTVTVATHALENRVSLLTAAGDETADPSVHQYLLPAFSCVAALLPEEREHLGYQPPLRFVRLAWTLQNQFAEKRALSSPDGEVARFLDGKWMDPTFALLAAYELVGRGALVPGHSAHNYLEGALHNLVKFYGSLADVRLLASLADVATPPPETIPLVRHGLLAWPATAPLPSAFPLSKLSYGGMWTAWTDVDA